MKGMSPLNQKLSYAFAPLFILAAFAFFACFIAVGILMLSGDIVELRKVISKATLVLLILSIFPLRKYLKLSWQEIGFCRRPLFFKQMGYGLLLSLLTLAPVLLTLYGMDIHIIDGTRSWTPSKAVIKISVALLLALLISFAEEPLFRGILLSGFKRKLAICTSIMLSSAYYAALHFLKNKTDVPYEDISLSIAFQLTLETFANWFNPEIFSALISLWVVGLFLAIIRTDFKQSMGVCVGCHAGWVWQIKVSKDFLNTNEQSEWLYLVSSYDGVVGPLVTVWLTLAICSYLAWKKFKPKSS